MCGSPYLRRACIFGTCRADKRRRDAAASKFAPQYFGADDREPAPAAVLAALRSYANAPGGLGEIDASGLARLAAFDTEGGRATIYAAPMPSGSGFCSVDALGDELGGGGCDDWKRDEPVPYIGSGSSRWGDVRVLEGRLVAPAARIQVRFEDGGVRTASIRAPWWVYVVGGDETEPGHRPVGLNALDADGAVVAAEAIKPSYYTAEDASEALLPEGDGSPGQDAVLATLKALGDGPWLEHERVEIDRTALLRRIETDKGRVDVYTAPWGAGGVCFGYASSIPSFEPMVRGCPSNDPVPDQSTDFDPNETSVARSAPSVFVIDGPLPRGAARIDIRFEDGSSAEPDIVVASSFVAWLAPERLDPGHRPTRLVAVDASGRTLATLPLASDQFTSG